METVGLAVFIILIALFILSFTLSFVAVALVLKLSHKKAWYDRVNSRKIHNGHIPRLGGIGFALVFILISAAICIVFGGVEPVLRYLPCFFALVFVLFFGVVDDFRPLKPRNKFIVQFVAAICVIVPGFIFRQVTFVDSGIFPVAIWYAITFIWIVGSTNAFNLIDGIDGLAGGLSGLIALFMGLIFFSFGITLKVLFCTAFVGVILGFLVFNAPFPRAKIFMGDGGSQFLGFLLALLPLSRESGSLETLPILYAAALFIIPFFDTFAAVWRRVRDGRKIVSPDKAHIHHKLMNLGLSVRGVDAVLYSLQIILGILTLFSIRLDGLFSVCVLGAAYLIGIMFFAIVHHLNRVAMKTKKDIPA